jgi:hypothetical protein
LSAGYGLQAASQLKARGAHLAPKFQPPSADPSQGRLIQLKGTLEGKGSQGQLALAAQFTIYGQRRPARQLQMQWVERQLPPLPAVAPPAGPQLQAA